MGDKNFQRGRMHFFKICFFLIIFLTYSYSINKAEKKWLLSLEFGNGHIITGTAAYRFPLISLGIGWGFDYSQTIVDIYSDSSKWEYEDIFLMSTSTFIGFHFLKEKPFITDLRLRFSYDAIMRNRYKAGNSITISPDLMLGYKWGYILFSLNTLIIRDKAFYLKKVAFLPQLGAGVRLTF